MVFASYISRIYLLMWVSSFCPGCSIMARIHLISSLWQLVLKGAQCMLQEMLASK